MNQCVHPDDLQQVKRLRDYGVLGERLMSMDGSFELEIRVWTKDHYRWMRLQFVMAEEKNGSPQVVVLSVRDIDTVKKQQEQLKEAMEFAQEQAERANRAKSIFFIEYVPRYSHADERDYGDDADRFGKYRGTGAGDGLPWKNRAGVRASFEID